MSRSLAVFPMVVITGLFFGCASVPLNSGFSEVQDAVRQRSGFRVHWEYEEGPMTERIRALLQHDLTNRDAVEIALLNNRRLQATFEELGIAQADLVQASLISNPILSLEVRFPGRPFEISWMRSILDLIQRPRRRRLAAAVVESAKLRVADEMLNLVVEVRSTCYALQGAKQMKDKRQTIVDAARASAELAIRQQEAGNISNLDLENEQVLFEQAKLGLAQSEIDTLAAHERLNRLMGLWGLETNWRLATNLPDLPSEELNLEGLESLAVSQRLDILLARQEVEVAARALPLARLGAVGEINAGVHVEREPKGPTTIGPAIEVPVPIFNRGKGAKARALAVFRQRQQEYAALAVEARSEVRAAWSRMLAARRRAEYFHDVILPRRRRIITFSQQQYNFMLLGAFQLLLAKQNEITAEREHIESLTDYWITRSELERAVGGNLPTDELSSPLAQTAEPSTDMKIPKMTHFYHRGEL